MHTEDINKTEYLHMMKNFCILPLHLQHTDIVISSLKFKTKNQVEPVNHVVVLFNTFKTMSDSIGSGVEGLLRGCGRVRITLCLLPPLSLILFLSLSFSFPHLSLLSLSLVSSHITLHQPIGFQKGNYGIYMHVL